MNYTDFVYLLMADEDKSNATSIEYWFRVLDTDADGVLSVWELEVAYDSLKAKLLSMGIDPMAFADVLCQVIDAIGMRLPSTDSITRLVRGRSAAFGVRLSDLKRYPKVAPVFLNAFINVNKYYDQEAESGNGGGDRATLEVGVVTRLLTGHLTE